jgi:hypothetical protein
MLGAPSGHVLLIQRQSELKGRTWADIAGGRQPSLMNFDDRPADRKSHAHAAGLRREEGVEEAVRVLSGDSDTAVLYCYPHLLRFVLVRSEHQFARTIRDRLHRFDAVHHQIDEHLLQLDPVTKHRRQRRRELEPQRDEMIEQLRLD